MFDHLRDDWNSIFERDRSAESKWEIILASPGFHAVCMHRMAHWCYIQGWSTAARVVSNTARILTGVDIHPAARIGHRLFIDHGTGVVIGDSVVIGDDCTIQQGATLLGADDGKTKTPLQIKDNVLVGAGAQLMGGITVGANAQIGPSAIVFKSVGESMSITCDTTTETRRVTPSRIGMSKELADEYTRKIASLESLVKEQGKVIDSLHKEKATQSVPKKSAKKTVPAKKPVLKTVSAQKTKTKPVTLKKSVKTMRPKTVSKQSVVKKTVKKPIVRSRSKKA